MAQVKTNAMRRLEKEKIPYQMHSYDHEDGAIHGVSVAEKLGQPPEQVFKTLVTKGISGSYFVFVIPVAKELNLKAAAKSVGEKSVEMIPVKEINGITGYVRGGCSPVGMKKNLITVLDESCNIQTTIIVSAGKIGFQVELSPQDLIRVTRAKTAQITMV